MPQNTLSPVNSSLLVLIGGDYHAQTRVHSGEPPTIYKQFQGNTTQYSLYEKYKQEGRVAVYKFKKLGLQFEQLVF